MRNSTNRPAKQTTTELDPSLLTVGIDLGDRQSEACVYVGGCVYERFRFPMTKEGVRGAFEGKGYGRIAMEAGAQSPWVTRLLRELGYEPLVANPRKLKMISANERKSDRNDALLLAKLAAADATLLYPIHHRSAERDDALAVLKARDVAVRARARLIHTVRSLAKAIGFRFRKGTTESFVRQEPDIPPVLRPALGPLFAVLSPLNEQIAVFDKRLTEMCEQSFPETRHLLQVHGVGPVTALSVVLTIEDPNRFPDGRTAAAYFGLVPRRDQSGAVDRQLRISKTGNGFARRNLVQAAQFMLGPLGQDGDLRRFGAKLVARGGPKAKKRAVVATARKLVVLLIRLWKSQSVWEPLFNVGERPAPLPPEMPEGSSETAILGDCAGPPDRPSTTGRRARDCSTDDGSDPTMHQVHRGLSTSADRSVEPPRTPGRPSETPPPTPPGQRSTRDEGADGDRGRPRPAPEKHPARIPSTLPTSPAAHMDDTKNLQPPRGAAPAGTPAPGLQRPTTLRKIVTPPST